MTDPGRQQLTVYQGKCEAFLAWSQPFIHRLLKSLEPHVRQVVLTQRVENAGLFPMPEIERLPIVALLSPLRAHHAACRLQQKYHGNVLHAHFGYTAAKLALLKVFLRVPMVVTFGGKDLTAHAARPETRKLYNALFDLAEQLVAVSDALRERAVAIGCPPEKIVTIRRGIDVEKFHVVDRTARRGGELGILMVSRLVPKKGHVDAVEALVRLPDDAPPWRLTVIGEGPEETTVRRRLREAGLFKRARFLGVVSTDRVREQMNEADILLHPSVTGEDGDQEGLPNALIEGHATGLPIVATRHGGIPELVRHEESGFLVEEHAPEALSTALYALLTSGELRRRFGGKGAEIVRQEFSLQRQVRDYLGIYQDLTQRYPPDHPSLCHISAGASFPELLWQSRAEAGRGGDLSISEMFESRFIDAEGDAETTEPWWYEAFWNLKRYVPRGLKFRVKKLLFQRFWHGYDVERQKEETQTKDDAVWPAVRKFGVPDPLEPVRSAASFLHTSSSESASEEVGGEDEP